MYSGSKTPTAEVIQYVKKSYANKPQDYQYLFTHMGKTTNTAIAAMKQQDLTTLATCCKAQQQDLKTLGVSNDTFAYLINIIHKMPAITATKISGAGLGDCLVTLGKLPPHTFPRNATEQAQGIQQIDIEISTEGTLYHE